MPRSGRFQVACGQGTWGTGRLHGAKVAPSSVSTSSLVCHGVQYPGCLQDVPALAVSLDNYAARSEEQYAVAAAFTVAMMKAVLVSS